MTEVVTDQTPPILLGPSDKEKKYDRQLRLWAANGQAALEDAHILLINSGSGTVGVETLKNLVLPGIGKFTIADKAIVNEADLGVNFFLEDQNVGQSRAKSCSEHLQELNPDVKGEWFPKREGEHLCDLLEQNAHFTLILYTNPIDQADLELVEAYGRQHKLPVFSLHSAGFYSYFRVDLPGAFPIVDTHPDSTATTDLRLMTPWPELSNLAADMTKDIDNLSDHEHGHIPYLILLLHFLEIWKKGHDGKLPGTYKEKKEFKAIVAAGARTNTPEGGEENFDEAVAAVAKTINPPSISSAVKEVFDYSHTDPIEAQSNFWIIADAIKAFHTKHGVLPLPGSVPDMKAQSAVYVKIQNLYKAKARQDAAEVLETVRAHPHGASIDKQEVETFCKNAAFIKLIHPSSSAKPLQTVAEQEMQLNADLTLLPIYLALLSTTHGAQPASQIADFVAKYVPDAASNDHVQKVCKEVARARGGELHNIAALTGGMVAQEIIKIITKQYIPIDNTCVFDGVSSRVQVLRL